ncbi:MAG: glycogen/starch/alpha-glucan family phosphorylase [Chitinivibrionales bacterium]|nr:glycogen/starch/alpha-glucan family phosphorylase [Chitinivibrionales bacterium]
MAYRSLRSHKPSPQFGGDSDWRIHFKGNSEEDLRRGFLTNLEYSMAKDRFTVTPNDQYMAWAFTLRDRLIERWILTQQHYHNNNVKRIYYLSFEFLMGRLLEDNMTNLGLKESTATAMKKLGLDMTLIEDQESDAGLGNGGLGRLAACFLDSMATLQLPAIGYGIRYEFGIFKQRLVNGNQRELPEEWLQAGNPWEIERPEYRLGIKYFGNVRHPNGSDYRLPADWMETEDVLAVPFDTPVPGYRNNTVNTLRLWSSRSAEEFNLDYFNSGDYIRACQNKLMSENISKVLYPNDNNHSGRELRLKQQHFFTSASLQDIIRRYLKHNRTFDNFPKKVQIQLNDTHPAIAIAELVRLLVDIHRIPWRKSWNIVTKTFAYTNHTLLPEALEKWPVNMMEHLLPRHMEIIYEINRSFLGKVQKKFPGDVDRLRRMSFIQEGPDRQVRMAHLAIAGSHSVNGVSALHTRLLSQGLVKDFYELWPEKFNNKTNGITPRRWLLKSNPSLSKLITQKLGTTWVTQLDQLKKLAEFADDSEFQWEWRLAKYSAKEAFARRLKEWEGIDINPDFLFDVQVKRMHEYKRQLLNILHCISLYDNIKAGCTDEMVPRIFFFGGKAAPGYFIAKLIIKFINNVASVINNDPDARELLKVHFVPNYRVSLAESIIPAADVSEQISTAGYEASGTGNMKFSLNGALTIGTMDGANIEIREEVGEDNIFIFGLRAHEIREQRRTGYNPWEYYNSSPRLKKVLDLVQDDYFSSGEPGLFRPLFESLLDGGDRFMVLADFDAYCDCQKRLCRVYKSQETWTKMSILNVAGMGKFSSDRTIQEYARDIWDVAPAPVMLDK